jgi:hypothetical protein
MLCAVVNGEALVLNGIYQGKDLYVKNPNTNDGVGFCVYEVWVNGNITSDELNSSAFAIDFNDLGILPGTEIEVIINHKKGCAPNVINPEAIKPHSTFEVENISVKNNVLTWSTKGESGALPFYVEQFKWNKWVRVGEVQGVGSGETHTYKFELSPYSGENKVRVKQVDYTKVPRYSKEVVYQPNISKVTFSPTNPTEEIAFSKPTQYEIFDRYGQKIKTGYGSAIDVSALEKGQEYYLNYDSSFGETFKKK